MEQQNNFNAPGSVPPPLSASVLQEPLEAPQEPLAGRVTEASGYLTGGGFDRDIADFKASAHLATGYKLLDRQQLFYPGLYVLGAVPGLGKTTCSNQLADQFAASGQSVLYFSLEQTSFELVSKSLARGFGRENLRDTRRNNKPSSYPTFSSMDIRRGYTASYAAEMAQQMNDYVTMVGDRVYIVDGIFSLTVEDIVRHVEAFIEAKKTKPLVVIDYLQIITPTLVNGRPQDTRTSIDHIVHTIKAMQSSYGLIVLLISSLNRQNYMTPIDFESFKESGGIEYTADVIWGLQLSIMSDDDFYYRFDPNTNKRLGETSISERREKVKQAKAEAVRKVDLVCLKNRYGRSSYTVPFCYAPASDFFYPPYDPNDPATFV